ncbi:MAG: hypothetical protein OXG29_04215, partial [Gammaproteobacteria bacterium]|nr:hypothetical protein [Gammaproteobacteria bacterium]
MEVVARGLADGGDAGDVLMALSYLLAPRSPYQAMAGWAAGAYTPRQAVARAVEHGFKVRGLRDQLRCVRARGCAFAEASALWDIDPGDLIVKLPEPARTLYLRERDLIDAWTAAAGLAAGQVAVGGGSVLAARWGHRRSLDVDVVVQGTTAYRQMLRAQQALDDLARRRGAEVLWVPRLHAVRITWPAADSAMSDKLDFFAEAETPPGYSERIQKLEGRPTRTLGTRQILWGKLDRCLRVLAPKDIFDIRDAGRRDADELVAAVNAFSDFAMRQLAQAFRSDAAAIGRKIDEVLPTVAVLAPGDGRIVAQEAGDAIDRCLYREVTVGVENGLVRVDRVTGVGPLPPLRWLPAETAVEAERTGVARYLDRNAISVVLEDAASVAGRSAGAAKVWTGRVGETVEWKRPPEALMMMAAEYAGRAASRRGAEADAIAPDRDPGA